MTSTRSRKGKTMELDEMKLAWQSLDRRLEEQLALNKKTLLQEKLEKAPGKLRPLVWGQGIQIVIGAIMALMAAGFWSATSNIPHLFYAGLSLHIYGLVLIVFGAAMQGFMGRVDYSAPVIEIQKQLAKVRSFYIQCGTLLGLVWWLLWIPLTMMAFAWVFGFDIYANGPPMMITSWWIIGFTGLLATLGFMAWARRRPALSKKLEDSAAGKSLNKAVKFLDEIAEFEKM
jgi:hypothetical protein